MALPQIKLDERTFQDLVDEAKLRIPRYCPEWTNHNVSDPGVTLIELFAYMVDQLLYQVNRVPEKNYRAFLDMIGVRLAPPNAARAEVTFRLSAAQPNTLVIPKGTEVATPRTESNEAQIFTTESDLSIVPPELKYVLTTPNSQVFTDQSKTTLLDFMGWTGDSEGKNDDASPPPPPELPAQDDGRLMKLPNIMTNLKQTYMDKLDFLSGNRSPSGRH